MKMTTDTKAEIAIVAIFALALIWLWLHNKNNLGAGTGLNLNLGLNPAGIPGTPNGFTIPSPVAGDIFNYTGNTVANPAPLSFGNTGGAGGGCSCSDNVVQSTFGSVTDLATWLEQQAGFSVAPIGSNWY